MNGAPHVHAASGMSAVVERLPDGSEKRIYRVYVDSRNIVDHENFNPDEYEFTLPDPIHNIAKVRLTHSTVNVSATFAVIRASGWRTVGSTEDDTAGAAIFLEAQNMQSATTTHRTPVTIYNTQETVQLQVVDAFYLNVVSGDGVDTRDYSVFMCTGRMESNTVSEDDMWLSDASITDVSMPQAISGTASDNASEYSATRTTTSTIYIATIRNSLHLSLWLNDVPLTRLAAPTTAFDGWRSFWLYQAGDIVGYTDPSQEGSPTLFYQCIKTHFAYIWATDLAAGLWLALSSTAGLVSADGMFHVIDPDDVHEHQDDTAYNKTAVEYETAGGLSGDTLRVKWTNHKGSRFFFPSFGTLQLHSVDDAPYAYGRRVFHPHKLTLEIEYFTRPESISSVHQ